MRTKSLPAGVVAVCAVLAITAPTASATHVRPQGATPIRAALVIAYQECTGPGASHAHEPPLNVPSCVPSEASSYLTAGTPDANGKAARFSGFVRVTIVPDDPGTPVVDEADILVRARMTDVRCKVQSGGCPAPLEDYIGEVKVNYTVRMTDHRNRVAAPDPFDDAATAFDVPFPLPMPTPCTATADANVGATCDVQTTLNAVLAGVVEGGSRSIFQHVSALRVFDGGADGDADTDGPPSADTNTLFAQEGVFVP